MNNSHISLPNVDRADSTLFKRYLEEQHRSVTKSNNHQQSYHPVNANLQFTYRQQTDTTDSKLNNPNPMVFARRKSSRGRKPSLDAMKQRTSHTSRFLKRFQRQHKHRDLMTNVHNHDGKLRFEFYDTSNTEDRNRANPEAHCTCTASVDKVAQNQHHQCSTEMPARVPPLSFKKPLLTSAQYRRQVLPVSAPELSSMSPKHVESSSSTLVPTTDKTTAAMEPKSNWMYATGRNSPRLQSADSASMINAEIDPTFNLDSSTMDISNEDWSLMDDLLQELSIEMSDKTTADMCLEIEDSLAQRIYDCIVEQDDEYENDTKSYSTITTNDSSAFSMAQNQITTEASHEFHDVSPSPIGTITKGPIANRERHLQPVHEPPVTSSNNLLDQERRSTSFNLTSPNKHNDTQSPFAQSLFEPVNLLRTVTTDAHDNFDVFPSSFSFDSHQHLNNRFPSFQQDNNQTKSELSTTSCRNSLPLLNHLLPPRASPIQTSNSAFKPIEPAKTRTATSFELKRPQVIRSSIGQNWLGQS